jgi:hypothetical protein
MEGFTQLNGEFAGKIKLFLCVINYAPHREDLCGSGRIAPPFLTSALDGGEWSASRPGGFINGERDPIAHWIAAYLGPRAGLDAVK